MTPMRHLVSVCAGTAVVVLLSLPAAANMVEKKVDYSLNGTDFEGVLVYDDAVSAKRPAVLMAPNWLGVTEDAVTKAKMLAGKKYVFFVADMYGKSIRPKNGQEAGQASGAVGGNPPLARARANKAFDVLLDEGKKLNLIDPAKTAAIGFCFGGGNVLELARSGRNVDAVVTFHGALTTKDPGADKVKAKVLVLHGADDPFQPKAARDALEAELKAAKVDYEIVAFGGAVHSFTDPKSHLAGKAEYNEKVTKRAYAMMNEFFNEVF
jgi:dienelactone hydrolase